MLFYIDESIQKKTTAVDQCVITASVFYEAIIRDFKRELFNINTRYWRIESDFDFEIKGRLLLSEKKIKVPKYQQYVEEILYLCKKYDIRWIATFRDIPKGSSQSVLHVKEAPIAGHLSLCFQRLLERISCCVSDYNPDGFGIMLYDALDKSRSETIARSMANFMFRTESGHKYTNVLPTPYFVDSKITEGIQIADLFAYIICAKLTGRKESDLLEFFNFIRRELMYTSEDGALQGLRGCDPKQKPSDQEEPDEDN